MDLHTTLNAIRAHAPDFTPKLGMILGSGLGSLAEDITERISIPYAELPGFPTSSVAGHSGQLVLGRLNGTPVMCLQGRAHLYEGTPPAVIHTMIRSLRLMGCKLFLVTNSSGSLRHDVGPGQLMMITDHINFQGTNPLVGPNDDAIGPRFVSMDQVYDLELQRRLLETAQRLNIPLATGVYLSVLGPCFETPAEIRAYRLLGADAVGMSTVPDVIIARHCGLRVVAIATITNFAAGMSTETLSHEGTLHGAQLGATQLKQLVTAFAQHCLSPLHRDESVTYA